MIFISHPTTTSQGIPVSHHRLVRAEISSDFSLVGMWLDAWVDEAARLAGGPPVASLHVAAPVPAISTRAGLVDGLTAALLADPMYAGGTVVPDASGTLADAQARQWAAIKAERDRRLHGTFECLDHTFDVDCVNVAGAALDALIAKLNNQDVAQLWVLADNTAATFDADQMIAIGRACKSYVGELWAISQALRAQIEAATTVAEVEAVTWPS